MLADPNGHLPGKPSAPPTPRTRSGSAAPVRDLADPRQGHHALQTLTDAVVAALRDAWRCPVLVHRAHPVVSVADNYDDLGYPPDAVTRDRRYTRYVSATHLLRSHTSAMIPPLLRCLAAARPLPDLLLACPGVVYRRDSIDRIHSGTPHQVDLWRVASDRHLGPADLEDMIRLAIDAALPGARHRLVPAVHPYTRAGVQVDVRDGDRWVEVGEAGVAHHQVLAGAGLDPDAVGGLALGLGLDRLLMLRKGIPDIRLLRSRDPRIAGQMRDLAPWRPVSAQPPVRRDVSVAVAADLTQEEIGDAVRDALGADADAVEEVAVLSETPWDELPVPAAVRLGIALGQKNALVMVVLRHLERTLTNAEANHLRDRIYAALHRGRPVALPGQARPTPSTQPPPVR